MKKTTESVSLYDHLDKMDTHTLLTAINNEDKKVAIAVEGCIPSILRLVDLIADKMMAGGRLFYVGAGTSGRLGVVDASECPPTFGVEHGLVVGLIAGGDAAIRKAVEFAEDSREQGWLDLQANEISEKDIVIGIAASGTTPYVIGALAKCQQHQITTGCIVCNVDSPVAAVADYAIECEVGPEFVTGSTRMKSGTAQKLILNMISTAVMIKIGRVEGNRMVNMQLSNEKLIERGTNMIVEKSALDFQAAKEKLLELGSVKRVLDSLK